MQSLLLAANIGTYLFIAAGVAAAAGLIYGIFRCFSRMSWGALEVLAAFGGMLLITLIPAASALTGYLVLVLCGLAVCAAVLVLSEALRGVVRGWNRKIPKGVAALNRLAGGLLGALNGFLIVLVTGGVVLGIVSTFLPDPPALLAGAYSSPIWIKCGKYATDVALVFFFVYSLKGGYRLGFGRYMWVGLSLSMSFAAVFGSLLLTLNVPFLRAFAGKIAGTMGYAHPAVAAVTGTFVAAFLVFLLFFAVIVVLTVFINKLFEKVNRARGVNIFSGIVMAGISYLFTVGVFTGIGAGLGALGGAASAYPALEPVLTGIQRFFEALCSSPIAERFNAVNPIVPLLS